MKKYIIILFLFLLACFKTNITNASGKPDAINSFNYDNSNLQLNVVTNSYFVMDRMKFAEEILQKCQNNTFDSILLSNLPNNIHIQVYKFSSDIKNKDPMFYIKYNYDQDLNEYKIRIDE